MTVTLPQGWTHMGVNMGGPYHRAVLFVEDDSYESGYSVFDIYETASLQELIDVTAEDGFWTPGAMVSDFVSGARRVVYAVHYFSP